VGAPRPRAAPAGLRRALVALGVIAALSLAARAAWLAEPCREPCRSAADRVLVFDETYYVNAARVIAGIHPPAGATYARAPLGEDLNAEHPQLAKLVMAASIELFGDGPFAWRAGSLLFGTLALLALFALVRAAGGSPAVAAGACALMAADNLLLVHGRIGTLDIYALAAMLCAAALYLRGRPLSAGVAIGVGSCFKLVAPYVLVVLALYELLRADRDLRAVRRLAGAAAVGAVVLVSLLAVLDAVAPPYDPVAGRTITGGPFAHLAHMISYAAGQVSPSGPHGIASYPWQWLVDYKPIVYLNIDPAHPAPGLYGIHPPVHFLGMISPPILLLALPALALAALGVVSRGAGTLGGRLAPAGAPPVLGLAWVLGTLGPFELLSLIAHRTSYLYYMVVVMPGLYVLAADLLGRARIHGPGRRRRLRLLFGGWALLVVVAAIAMYPLTPVP